MTSPIAVPVNMPVRFLGGWCGKLVCDDYGGYKEGFRQGITAIRFAAHARRKFYELHANH